MSDQHDHASGFHGPKCWVVSILVGLLAGWGVGQVVDIEQSTGGPTGGSLVRVVETRDGQEHVLFPKEDAGSSIAHPGPAMATAGALGEAGLSMPTQDADGHHDDHADDHADHGEHADESGHGHDDASHGSDHGDHGADHGAHGDGHGDAHHAGNEAVIPIWLLIPFVVMLLSIAVMPFISERFWHNHFADFAFFLGSLVLAFYLFGPMNWDYHGSSYGMYKMTHVGLEYFAFIALIGGLYVASGGLYIDVKAQGRPGVNTALLAFGAVIANIVGTTGASVLLIRPFMRINKGRLKPIHVVMFIFIVSNCGGSLTPIGDPPLYLGFLRGVPFEWTLIHLWPMWAACIAMLLVIFYVIDSRIGSGDGVDRVEEVLAVDESVGGSADGGSGISVRGVSAMIALGLIVAAVFIDPIVASMGMTHLQHKLGPAVQILIAAVAYFVANKEIHASNQFNFFPVKEVGFLFVGIFTTMAPALAYLEANASSLGIDTPSLYYFGTGALSACLDNAPTYLNFLQAAFGVVHLPLDPTHISDHFLVSEYTLHYEGVEEPTVFSGAKVLAGISLGAVFFGAMTYIGNGPNFMVKSIAESSGVKMPSFFGYLGYSLVLLLPVLILIWAIFLR